MPRNRAAAPGASHKVNAKAGVNFKASKDLLLYGIFSQGFRDGGVNSGLGESCYNNGAPATYKPDTLNNFEVGWKSTLLDRRMTWNGAFYYMRWSGYQASVFDLAICPSGFNANLGDAHIYGAESNIDYKIAEGLTIQVSGSYNDSHLVTNTFQNADFVVVPGERLPYVPYFSYSAMCANERPVTPSLVGFVQYDIAHKGDMWSDLGASPMPTASPRSLQPSYEISNLRFGVHGPNEHWSAEAYVTICWTRTQSSIPTPATTTAARPPTNRASSGCGSVTAGGRVRMIPRPPWGRPCGLPAACCCWFSSANTVRADAARPLIPDDLYRVLDVSDPQVSPDGRWVAYVVSSNDRGADEARSAIWQASWDGRQRLALTAAADGTEKPRFSRTGAIWPSVQAGRIRQGPDHAAGPPRRRCRPAHQGGRDIGDFAWAPDGKRLVFTMTESDSGASPSHRHRVHALQAGWRGLCGQRACAASLSIRCRGRAVPMR